MSIIGERYQHLDMLRGLAALLVLAEHSRAYVFVNWAGLNEPGLATTLFYAVTGLASQAVVVFFALSGFLVGGAMLEAMGTTAWSWRGFLARRLTRLWIVVFPLLLVTLILDRVGLSLSDGAGYQGIDLSLGTFVGNLAFLQTIAVPAFGTLAPIWSLANIFWYYILSALFFSIFLVRMHALQRIFCICLLLSLLAWLPNALLIGGLSWLAGTFAGVPGRARCSATISCASLSQLPLPRPCI